ncbi:hypothetical protein N5E30_04425, partial [Pseudomonas chengduensis]
ITFIDGARQHPTLLTAETLGVNAFVAIGNQPDCRWRSNSACSSVRNRPLFSMWTKRQDEQLAGHDDAECWLCRLKELASCLVRCKLVNDCRLGGAGKA